MLPVARTRAPCSPRLLQPSASSLRRHDECRADDDHCAFNQVGYAEPATLPAGESERIEHARADTVQGLPI